MDYPLIWSIGRIGIPICPCCKSCVSYIHSFKVNLISRKKPESKKGKYRLAFCEECKIPFTTKALSRINKLNFKDYYVPEFTCSDSMTANEIRRRMNVPIVKTEKLSDLAKPASHDEIIKNSSNETITTSDNDLLNKIKLPIVKPPRFVTGVYSNTIVVGNYQECQKCNSSLVESETYIPINKKGRLCVEVHGKRCPTCGCLYVTKEKKQDIITVLSNNPYAVSYRLVDGIGADTSISKDVANQTRKEKKRIYLPREDFATKEEWRLQNRLARYPSAILLMRFTVGDELRNFIIGDELRNFIIVNDEKDINMEGRVYHYSSRKARTLLTIAYFPQCIDYLHKEWKDYKFVSIVQKTTGSSVTLPVIQNDIFIRKGGGYHEKDRPVAEVVNALLYSPYTHRLELVRASYDKTYNEYYMDPIIFRQFVDSYGNPGIPIRFSGKANESAYGYLNEESILKVYGYNVSQVDGLLSGERHAILTELVDLNIVTISTIVRLFDFFISSHPGDSYYYAREKWEDDKQFISNYKTNPNRFIIGGRIHR